MFYEILVLFLSWLIAASIFTWVISKKFGKSKKIVSSWVVGISICLWVFVYMLCSQSEAFEVAVDLMKKNAELTSKIGEVKTYRMGFYNFAIGSQGSDRFANFIIVVKGTVGSGEIVFKMNKAKSQPWHIEQAILVQNENPIIDIMSDTAGE